MKAFYHYIKCEDNIWDMCSETYFNQFNGPKIKLDCTKDKLADDGEDPDRILDVLCMMQNSKKRSAMDIIHEDPFLSKKINYQEAVEMGLVHEEAKQVKRRVVLAATVQTGESTYTTKHRVVDISFPDDGLDWHVCGEMIEE